MLQRKAGEHYQNLPDEEKTRNCAYARNRYRKLFTENEFSQEEENRKPQYPGIYITTFLKKKKDKKHEYACEKHRNFSKKEKDKKRQYACKRHRYLSKKLPLLWKYKKDI